MSPSQFQDDHQQARKTINGQRPTPLKINKDSHLIQKSSSSSSSTSSSFNGVAGAATKHHQHQHQHNQQRHHPVIIYTHSPKIIHTQARDFMALVQKLTGLSRSDDDNRPVQPQLQKEKGQSSSSDGNNNSTRTKVAAVHEDNESSSAVTDENCGGGGGGGRGEIQVSSFSVSPPVFEPSANPFFADIPLFTPNSAEFFCSPRPFYRYPNSVLTPSNMGSSISPSVLEVMKTFHEY